VAEPSGALTRPRPSRGRIWARRAAALVVLAAGFGALAWGLSAAVGDKSSPPPPPPPPPVARGPKILHVVFPEGFTRRDMAARITAVDGIARRKRGVTPRLSASRYLALTASSTLPGRFARDGKRRSLEGFLFPATYAFTARTRTKDLVAYQLRTFRKKWSQVNMRYARSKNLTPYDVITIASMIEKEVRAPSERRLVAAVIYNRLRHRMALGIDATIRYALDVPPTQSLRESQLHDPTPYNTRLHAGLPPTPIANPGLASLQAAAHPAKVNYLYFVRKPDKIHHFFTASAQKFDDYERAHGY
jgi:peptidoglycan lytic transglycosylase G